MENVYEQFFTLKHHGGWSFIEAYNLPIRLRDWFLERLMKQFKMEQQEMEKTMKKSSSTPGKTEGELGDIQRFQNAIKKQPR